MVEPVKDDQGSILEGEICPVCRKKDLTLREMETEVPYFGKLFVFSMTCNSCKYHKADIEAAENKEPVRFSMDIKTRDDMMVRVVKSSEATVKIPHVGSIDPGPASEGYVSNVEGIFQRIRTQVESIKNNEEDDVLKKKAKNLLKKIDDIMWGRQEGTLIIEDPSGNSAIISEKATRTALKKK